MKKAFDPYQNYLKTREKIGYTDRESATQADYDRIGFMSGLEVHQQLKTKKKLFCNCPAGIFHDHDDYDAEVIRHMRPTLSELGEYDGTALMEFKTRKNIVYRINNENACTYEVDDTPPFLINREALDIAFQITMLCKMNLVGEVHIIRKQYLDGSIPTGFQRTAILGVEGDIQLKNKKVRLIQLSIEEDSCREISDIGHWRIYKTDRLGMPLIETVTYPEFKNPDEVKEGCDVIRFINRSTGKVRTGIGASRQDVNVSCKGGTRIEIKGVAHTKWIPELTHVEAFRQWALLAIREELLKRFAKPEDWKPVSAQLDYDAFEVTYPPIKEARDRGDKLYAVKLPGFKGIMSHFTQPTKTFADEISDRLKVIACIEKPHMVHTEDFNPVITDADMEIIGMMLNANMEKDAVLVFWSPEDDVKTALEVIEERCRMAFAGVPNETRKSFEDGSTIFERVLPGADRMYPDTDSAPIPIAASHLEELAKGLPTDITELMGLLRKWEVPDEMHMYLLSKNLVPLIGRIGDELKVSHRTVAMMMAKRLKYVEGHYTRAADFNYNRIYDLIKYAIQNNLECPLMQRMLPVVYEHPNMDFQSVLTTINFKKYSHDEIFSRIEFANRKFETEGRNKTFGNRVTWIMGQLRPMAEGNIALPALREEIEKRVK
ncbi:MAG TPA: Glu-tRNA(Gln) amidotransferase subunit GatE [Bacteroidales bacterium]|nr:Glu-tRNA(Gln) amidotransferase subunit GatE [Bacteroidales bacterium]